MNKIKILAVTIGTKQAASSRLRSYNIFDDNKNFQVCRELNFKNLIKNDILHIQKKLNLKILFFIIISKLLNKIIIFDLDDQPESFRENIFGIRRNLIHFLFIVVGKFSNIITVDT